MKISLQSRRAKILAGVSGLAALAVIGVATVAVASGFGTSLKDKVQKEFPNTPITSADCDKGPANLCEVVAGSNVFYVTRDAKFAFVGAVLDLENKVDVTDVRLRELAAVGQAEARIRGAAPAAPGAPGVQPASAPAAPADSPIIRVTLPKANAVVHNPGAPLKMTIFTDLNCGFCKRLHDDLKNVRDIEVTEYPIAFMGPDSPEKAKLALCAKDRVAGIDAIYSGGEVVTSGDCAAAEAAVAANVEFARQNGINGTPMIVRADGRTNSGWMPVNELRAFLGGAS